MTIQALIFDFDGTIVDSEGPDYESWEEIFKAHGTSLSLDQWMDCVGGGPDDFDPYAILAAQTGRAIRRSSVRSIRRARFLELVKEQPIMSGVVQWLDDADRAGLKLAVASSSDSAWVNGHLESRGLRDRFICVHTRDDVKRVKPDPALYRISVEALGLQPHEAVALEDSRNGILAAKNAGLHCIAIPNAITQKSDFSEADIRLNSLEELTVAELLNRFAVVVSED